MRLVGLSRPATVRHRKAAIKTLRELYVSRPLPLLVKQAVQTDRSPKTSPCINWPHSYGRWDLQSSISTFISENYDKMPQILGEYDADRGAAILGLISRGIISRGIVPNPLLIS
jgi:hypothetical protein